MEVEYGKYLLPEELIEDLMFMLEFWGASRSDLLWWEKWRELKRIYRDQSTPEYQKRLQAAMQEMEKNAKE